LFVALHELAHASEEWSAQGPVEAVDMHIRGMVREPGNAESEDRADIWAALILAERVSAGNLRLATWENDVQGYVKRERWPIPTAPVDVINFAIFLYFEYLEAAGRFGHLVADLAHRPPRQRYDAIYRCLSPTFPTRSYVEEFRELLSTIATAGLFRRES
jgi:hypothetical protein